MISDPLRRCRQVAMAGIFFLPSPAGAQASPPPDAQPFSHETVQRLAQEVASKPYVAPDETLPQGLDGLDYDAYRQIRFRQDRTLWRGQGLGFEVQPLPVGWLFKAPVEINLVENGAARVLQPSNAFFNLGPLEGKLPPGSNLGFSGFRVTGPLNRPDKFDEIVVFQGASYFRALSRNQTYGVSARGLALNVAQPEGEEFPQFRRFWIEKPAKAAGSIIIHALLDSPSVAGAYKFRITPGAPTVIDVEMTLYPRRELTHVGIAPLTSMFLFSSINRARINDFRPAVHDSDGLAILNGWEERIWRPLSNPRRLQTSSFLDKGPKGFGLIQRVRDFSEYQDLEAHYERRPSTWVEAVGDWGPGAVQLVEIPTEEEIHDNIVAFWRPAAPLSKGKPQAYAYRLIWPNDVPLSWPGAVVHKTRAGPIIGPHRKSGAIQFVIDFTGPAVEKDGEVPTASVSASAGAVSAPVVQANPEINGVRVSFAFDPKGESMSELRLALNVNDRQVSESWLYRWTKE